MCKVNHYFMIDVETLEIGVKMALKSGTQRPHASLLKAEAKIIEL